MRNWKWTWLETRNDAACAFETLGFGDGVEDACHGEGTYAYVDCVTSSAIGTCDADLWLEKHAAFVGSQACVFLQSLSVLRQMVTQPSLWALALTTLSEAQAQAPSRQTPWVASPRLAFPLA